MSQANEWDNEVTRRLREYVKIPSVQPDVDYGDCIKFLQRQAKEIDLPIKIHELVPKKPVVVFTWEGTQPKLKSIMLNSHMDVVPVYEDHWTYPPFSAHLTEDGWIYGRGISDMKAQGMLYLEAIRRLKSAGIKLKRTVHVTFVPDEEIGGTQGMGEFVKSQEFKDLNVGFEMDETIPCPSQDELFCFHAERTCRQIKVTCTGKTCHGALLETNTAGEKMAYIINKFAEFRSEEMKKDTSLLNLGNLTTVNLTKLEGGVQVNVTPENLTAYYDIRIAPHVDHHAFDKMIEKWCEEAGEGVFYEYMLKNPEVPPTETEGLPMWDALVKVIDELGIKLRKIICAGTTDARYLRQQGIPAINLTAICDTPALAHCHDEKMHAREYIRGIGFMEKILCAIANS